MVQVESVNGLAELGCPACKTSLKGLGFRRALSGLPAGTLRGLGEFDPMAGVKIPDAIPVIGGKEIPYLALAGVALGGLWYWKKQQAKRRVQALASLAAWNRRHLAGYRRHGKKSRRRARR